MEKDFNINDYGFKPSVSFYEKKEVAQENNWDILLEYSEKYGVFNLNFVDKDTWEEGKSNDCFIVLGYTDINEYKAFLKFAAEEGCVFDGTQEISADEVKAVFGNFKQGACERKSMVLIDGIEVPTFERQMTSANIINVVVGTNGYQGGDTGHGGRTYFAIDDESSTDMRCIVTTENGIHDFTEPIGSVKKIELSFGGDCELDTFIDALEFAANKLNELKHG